MNLNLDWENCDVVLNTKLFNARSMTLWRQGQAPLLPPPVSLFTAVAAVRLVETTTARPWLAVAEIRAGAGGGALSSACRSPRELAGQDCYGGGRACQGVGYGRGSFCVA